MEFHHDIEASSSREEEDPMQFHYDFEASSGEKALIHEKTCQGASSTFVFDFHCHVQKYETYDEACKAHRILTNDLMVFAPETITAFEMNGKGYLSLSVRGVPFIPCKDDLFESKDSMFDGNPKALFITHKYKQILRHLITSVCLQKDYQIRARINLGSVYAWYAKHTDYHAAYFAKYDLQDRVKDDDSKVIKELIQLIKEINTKCCIEDPCEAEFNVLFNGFTMPKTPYDINVILGSVIFWTKAERMEFLRRILKLAKAKEIDVCGESIKVSLGTDWGSKLKQMETWVNASSKRPRLEIDPEELVVDVIERIVYAYDHVAELTQGSQEEGRPAVMFENGDGVVEYVQYSFPTFFAVLAEQARKLKWPVGNMVEDFLSKRLVEEQISLQTGVPMPDAIHCCWDSDDEEVAPCAEALECLELDVSPSIWYGPAAVV